MKIESIWREYKVALKRFIHTKVANDADVEDLLQEVLIKTYNNLGTLKKQASIKSWLFQITNHVIIDFYRKSGKSRALAVEDTWYREQPDEVRNALSDCISPFIKGLPKEQADLLTAIDLENRSQKAYAAELGISYSTLKSRVQASRKKLKETFDDCCHFQLDKGGTVFDYEHKLCGSRQCD